MDFAAKPASAFLERTGTCGENVMWKHIRRHGDLRRSTFAHALWTAAIMAACAPAFAVHVNQHGLGQVLLYPYYTTRTTPSGGPFNSLLVVTNTTADTKIVRIRARESKNGRQVASINVYLVPFDSWTAAILPPSPGSMAPELLSNDQSCIDPQPPGPPYILPFSNAQYSGPNADFEDDSLARAGEGFVEVFEMGVIKDPAILAALQAVRSFPVLPDCPPAVAVSLDDATKIGPPTGGLMGSAFLVNVNAGTLYSYDATALDDFSQVALWSRSTASAPTLDDVNPKTSRVLDGMTLHQSAWDVAKGARAADPVSAVLMQNQLLNFFVLDPGTRSGTDWIVTLPTKPSYVSVAGASSTPPTPFESSFAKGGAPDSFGVITPSLCSYPTLAITGAFDREGIPMPPAPCFGVPLPAVRLTIYWTVNVITFGNPGVFGSDASVSFFTGFPNGWAHIGPLPNAAPSPAHKLVSTDNPPVTYFGLPMIGFMANNFTNGALTIPGGGPVLSNYGATSAHRGLLKIE